MWTISFKCLNLNCPFNIMDNQIINENVACNLQVPGKFFFNFKLILI